MYDLEERTFTFSKDVILLIQRIPKNEVNRIFINQLIRSSTSVGANYMEADGAESKKDTKHKFCLCRKEIKESCYWLRLIKEFNQKHDRECKLLIQEAFELSLIFSSIIKKIKVNSV